MARLNFFVDKERCISCFSCQVACSSAHEIPVGVNRRKVITLNEGVEGQEISTTIACQHCEDAPCQQVCPVDCFYIRTDGIVLHDKDKCIGCAYCLYACPFGAPQFNQSASIFRNKGVMDKCTMCAGGPLETNSEAERHKYGQNRIAEGKVPMCAAVCSTNALIVGESEQLQAIFAKRVEKRESGIRNVNEVLEWQVAYEKKNRS